MSTVGQIVYNLEDWHASGGYISTSASSKDTTISSWTAGGEENTAYDSGRFDIYSDIVAGYGATEFSKLGIQAPPGTKVTINTTKTIMIGRTGTYELDEDIAITSLKFEKTYIYVIDTTETNKNISEGQQGMQEAEDYRVDKLVELDTKYEGKKNDSESLQQYWEEYAEIQTAYEALYEPALAKFNTGINGVYKLPNATNTDAEENYQELKNVIIDFIY